MKTNNYNSLTCILPSILYPLFKLLSLFELYLFLDSFSSFFELFLKADTLSLIISERSNIC